MFKNSLIVFHASCSKSEETWNALQNLKLAKVGTFDENAKRVFVLVTNFQLSFHYEHYAADGRARIKYDFSWLVNPRVKVDDHLVDEQSLELSEEQGKFILEWTKKLYYKLSSQLR
jgi:hypothetical protein